MKSKYFTIWISFCTYIINHVWCIEWGWERGWVGGAGRVKKGRRLMRTSDTRQDQLVLSMTNGPFNEHLNKCSRDGWMDGRTDGRTDNLRQVIRWLVFYYMAIWTAPLFCFRDTPFVDGGGGRCLGPFIKNHL